jgi:predicted nucleotidyltransferase component of viral defense system
METHWEHRPGDGALFDDSFLQSQIAMCGGTLLHKVHLAPPSRYSENIDLVVVGDRKAAVVLHPDRD